MILKLQYVIYAPTHGCTNILAQFPKKKKSAELFSCYQQSWDTDSPISCLSRHNAAVSNKTHQYTHYEVDSTADMSRRVIDQMLWSRGVSSPYVRGETIVTLSVKIVRSRDIQNSLLLERTKTERKSD